MPIPLVAHVLSAGGASFLPRMASPQGPVRVHVLARPPACSALSESLLLRMGKAEPALIAADGQGRACIDRCGWARPSLRWSP